jgi:hypothetical protein
MAGEVRLIPGAEFRALAPKMRKAPKEVRKAVNLGIRQATKPAETALKAAVNGLESAAARGGGSRQRLEHARSRSKSKKFNGTLGAKHGLRRNIAKGVTRKITYTGKTQGVRIRADAKYLPDAQRVLVKATNRGKVRHPVYGSDTWVDQSFSPPGWFDNTMATEGPIVRDKIATVARSAMDQLQ